MKSYDITDLTLENVLKYYQVDADLNDEEKVVFNF